MSVEQELDKFGRFLIQQSRSNLTRNKKKDRGTLYDSLDYKVKVSKNSFQFSFLMEDYGTFVDKGVKGFSSSSKAPTSPFKFGTGTGKKGGLTNSIDGWVKRKRIQFREKKSGKFMSYKSTSFLIRNSIWHKGLETTNFYNRPFELGFKKLPKEVVKAYSLEVKSFLENSFNN